VLCGYVPSGGVSVQQAVADEVLETVQHELDGRFQLQVLLRRDRRSNLYVARDLETDRLVALRLIPRPGPVDDDLLQRFEQAAGLAAQLRHPHLTPVLNHGVTTSLLWYSTEPVKGRTITQLLERGPRSRAAVQELLEQAASGLEFLHRNGVVHGGVSPVTVLVDGDGWARITDPGIIATLFRAAPPRSGWEDLLDPAYAAPEVLERRLVGPAADQYSLALVAYLCLAGRPAWAGDTIDGVRRERAAGAEPLEVIRPDVPAFVVTALARALRDSPADRFGSVLDFVAVVSGAALRSAGSGLSPSMSPGGPPVLVMPESDRRPGRGRRVLIGAGLALLGAAATWGVLHLQRPAGDRWVVAPPPAGPERAPVPPPVSGPEAAPAGQPPRTGNPVPAGDTPAATPIRPARPVPPAVATLFVNSSPWGAVFVDGRAMGNTPRPNLEVPAGVHRLRVVRDGYAPFEREIRLTPGQVLRITDIVLEPINP
jgi:serine/threonine-protein kinase